MDETQTSKDEWVNIERPYVDNRKDNLHKHTAVIYYWGCWWYVNFDMQRCGLTAGDRDNLPDTVIVDENTIQGYTS